VLKLKLSFLIVALLLVTNISNSQWFWQNPLPQGNDIRAIHFVKQSSVGYMATVAGTFLKTTDYGLNWKQLNTSVSVPLYSIFFVNESTGFAGGDYGAFYKTINGGNHWYTIDSTVHHSIRSIFFTSANTGYYSSRIGKLRKTTNGGDNWIYLNTSTTKDIYSIFFLNETTGYVGGSSGLLLKTTNSGNVWFSVSAPHFSSSSLYFMNINTGFVGGVFRLIKTTNGGLNWSVFNIGYSSRIDAIRFINDNIGYAAEVIQGNLFKTTNGGDNWFIQNINNSNFLYSMDFINSSTGCIVGSQGTIIKTTDGGENWSDYYSIVTNRNLRSISFVNQNTGFVCGESGIALKTTNSGQNWNKMNTIPNYYFCSIYFPDENNGYIGASGTILKTTDSGYSWLDLNPPIVGKLVLYLFMIDSSTGFGAGSDGMIIRTTNAGTNWEFQNSGTSYALRSIKFININTGYIVGGSYTNYIILKTTNSGNNWIIQGQSSPIRLFSVDFINVNTGYTSGDGGVILKTTNGGNNWKQLISGYTDVNLISIKALSDNVVYAVGGSLYNSIIIKSTDGGDKWIPQESYTNNALYDIEFTNDSTAYIVGKYGTILKTTNGGTIIVNTSRVCNYIPSSFKLFQNYPNPFNPTTTIRYDIKTKGDVELKVFDLLGRDIATLVNENQTPGTYEVVFDATSLPSGVYLYKLITGDFVETRKMVVIK